MPRPTASRRPGARAVDVWPYVVVFALGCLAYAWLAGIYFLKDDLALSRIADASGRPDAGALTRNFLWPAPLTYPQVYRPVPILFGWFDFCIFGADPAGFRICNIGFHGLNAALLAMLFNQLTGFRRPVAGLFCGALFALHPIHGEAILWITQRMVVLCATFSLVALIAFEAHLRTGRRVALAVAVAAASAAALTKEVTVTLPAVMLVLAALHPGSARERLRKAAVASVAGVWIGALVVVPRKLFFGDWIGRYTHLTPSEYAAEFRVFERLPKSLLDGFWSVNPTEVPEAGRFAFGVAWLAFLALALARLVPALADRSLRRAAAALAAFAVASFLPTLLVFYIEPTLLNGRFLYQPLLGVLGLLLLGFASAPSARPLVMLAAPAALTVLFSLALQLNLRAWGGADAQIRAIREGILREAAQVPGNPIVVVYDAPTEYHGVVTLDLSLALAMRPPFVPPPGLDVVPLIVGLDRTWAGRVPEIRALLEAPSESPRPILHLEAKSAPDRISPLVGSLGPGRGRAPPTVLAPADGAILVHPAESPAFVFDPSPGAARYRMRFAFEPAVLLPDIVLDLDPARHLRRAGTRLLYRFENGQIGETGLDWAAHRFENPLPIAWSVEALDAGGRSLGRSAERALVLLTTQSPAE